MKVCDDPTAAPRDTAVELERYCLLGAGKAHARPGNMRSMD